MVYTVTEHRRKGKPPHVQTFEGFRHLSNVEAADVVGIACVEGEAELWELDPTCVPLAVEELLRYYRFVEGIEDVSVAVFVRVTQGEPK